MGFFASGGGRAAKKDAMPSLDMLHRLQCRACPLNRIEDNLHPHMAPAGSKKPVIYILGEAPGKQEDEQGRQFVGASGRLLRANIPDGWLGDIRWNNVVRTRPPGNRAPEKIEVECCRPSIEADIVASKPDAIFGFGNVPLQWALGQSGINKWRGRRIPVNVAGHVCWFFPFTHPAAILRQQGQYQSRGKEEERTFQFDLQRAFAEAEELPKPRVWTRTEAEANVQLLTTMGAVREALRWTLQQPAVGMDWETKNKRPYGTDSCILSLGIGTEKRSFAFPLDHPQVKWTAGERKELDKLVREFLCSPVVKLVHNAAFEMEWAGFFYGTEVLRAGPWECSYVQAATLDERIGDSKPGCLGLEFLILQHCGLNIKDMSPLNRKKLDKEPLADVLRYNAIDAKFHYILWHQQEPQIEAQGFREVYEMRLRRIPTLVLTQIKGVPLDQQAVDGLIDKYAKRVAEQEDAIAALPEAAAFKARVKETFNPASNKHMAIMCRDILKSRAGENEGGGYSVDETVLEKIKHPLAVMELKRRKAAKRLSTYILPYSDKTAESMVWPDGLLHPIINPIGTISDRTSAEEPNIQNIPKRGEEAKEVRKAIRAPEGHLLVAVDHGQIQARGIAMVSKDKVFVQALWERYDIHTEWAERISRAYPSRVGGAKNFADKKVMKAFRTDVKNQWTFPLFFGAALPSVAEYLKVPENVLEPLFKEFWRTFEGVAQWHEDSLKFYHKHGYVRHPSGLLNRAPLSRNQLFNYPIQGVEAHIVLDGMNRLSEREVWEYQANLEIHDDLTFILPVKDLDRYVETIVTDMLAVDFDYINVPLTCEVSVGQSLYDMQEVLTASSDSWGK